MLQVRQIRAARALLSWRQDDLAEAAGVGLATIRRLEASLDSPSGNVSTIEKIERAFEKAGVKFLNADDHGGIGVRLSKRSGRKS